MKLPTSASFASLHSALETLGQTTFLKEPLCLFFDQFENRFVSIGLTEEFRNLAYLPIADVEAPVLLGFAWKTDLVAFTEGHPYQLRDDIRARARVISLDPFGADDVSKLLGRMQKVGEDQDICDLREKLRQIFSRGSPWLLKEARCPYPSRASWRSQTGGACCGSRQIFHSLFDSDIKTLSPEERGALHAIARNAPMLASDAVEVARSPRVVQSLVDERLLVQIGERLDVDWQTFRGLSEPLRCSD